MQNLKAVDYTIIVVYFSFLVALGMYLKKKASASLEHYFLGDRQIPWWALGISGMASFLDITGTMVIVSFLFMLGPRGLFVEFRGGAVLVLAFMLLWTGKWHRRSGCITGAEWMIYRFGDGYGGQFARVVSAIAAIAGTIGMLAYLSKGIGLFLSMFIPLEPYYCTLVMLAIATVYTMVSGFYGVVFTDLFQSLIILIAVLTISIMASMKIDSVESLSQLAFQITGSNDWLTCYPQWKTNMPMGGEYQAFEYLALFAFFYFIRNFLGGAGSGQDPKYFGARSDRECGKLTFLWTWLMMFRWPMMMGFAVLGLFLVKDLFPDTTVLADVAALIHQHFPDLDKAQWADTIGAIRLHPDNYPQLTQSLHNILGDDWANKINLIGYEGSYNPERILPAVILFSLPPGFRGLILVALIAASMSTFDSTVNTTTGYFTRDIYQRYFRRHASTRELIYISWAFIIFLVAVGFALGYITKSINEIWGWIIMGLGGGLMIPGFLRLYWHRFNGGGFAVGTTVGLSAAVLQKALWPIMEEHYGWPSLNDWHLFLLIGTIGLIATVIGTYLTKPTDQAVLENFYKTTRPFGLWGPLRKKLPADIQKAIQRENRHDLAALPFALTWQVTLFLLPLALIVRNFSAFWITLFIFLVSLLGLYFIWYRNLPED